MVITATVRRSKEQVVFAASAINHCIGRGQAAFVLRNPTGRLELPEILSDLQSGLAEQSASGPACPSPALAAKMYTRISEKARDGRNCIHRRGAGHSAEALLSPAKADRRDTSQELRVVAPR